MEGRRRSKRGRANQSSSRPVLACGVLLVSVVLVELWVMHHHGPTHRHNPTPQYLDSYSRLPGVVSPGKAEEHDSLSRPGAPSVPDSMRAARSRTEDDEDVPREPRTERPAAPAAVAWDHPKEDRATVAFELPPRQTLSGSHDDGVSGSEDEDGGYGDMRVAVLIPYSGPGLPIWFDAFTDLAASNKDLVDWLIFCEEDLAQVKTPPNVRMISTSPAELAWMLAGVVYPADADERPDVYVSDFHTALMGDLTDLQMHARNVRGTAARFIQKLLAKNPYYMVEFKPALGWVFREYLKDYTHWAYGDLDVFFGDLTKGWLEPSEMRDYDIITYSFGDQQRAYLRGQLTVHKSTHKVNHIWRGCPHLSNYYRRIERTMETKQYNLESAEGCYSMALMYSKDVKAKYAVKVFTDMPGGKQDDQEEVVITGDGLVKRCPQQQGRRGDVVEPDFGGKMQVDRGEYFPVETEEQGYFCEYWISPNFQTCLKLKESLTKTNVFLLEGRYYEREFVNLWQDKVEDGCSMGAFHHFQELKGNYRAWNTRPQMSPVHRGMVAGNGGLVPLPNGDWHSMTLDPNAPPPADRDRFTHRYCLQWSVENERTTEAKFKCDISLTPRDGLRILHDSRRQGGLTGGAAVTLGGVGGVSDVPRLLRSCRDWEGPKIIVLMLNNPQRERGVVLDLIRAEEKVGGLDNAYIVFFFSPSSGGQEVNGGHLPTKALLNAVGDLCQTRHLLILPSDFRIARGAEQAVVTALKTPTEAPRVLIIPQWCVDRDHERGSGELPTLELEDLRRQAADGTADLCFSDARTNRDLYLGGSVLEGAVYGEGAGEGLGDAGARHGGMGGTRTTKNGLALLVSNAVSPVIVVDMWSAPALFLRHIEELSGSRCFDGAYARGLWAAGFSFEVLPEAAAFTASLPPRTDQCRHGVMMQMGAYSTFLQDVRRVYWRESGSFTDIFKKGVRSEAEYRAEAKARSRRRANSHPFHRQMHDKESGQQESPELP
ncbi:unnamed protein product [Ectocarpus sp. 12 AP-2014]